MDWKSVRDQNQKSEGLQDRHLWFMTGLVPRVERCTDHADSSGSTKKCNFGHEISIMLFVVLTSKNQKSTRLS